MQLSEWLDQGVDHLGSIPVKGKKFLFSKNVQTGSRVHPVPYSMTTSISSLGVKGPGCDADSCLPSCAEV